MSLFCLTLFRNKTLTADNLQKKSCPNGKNWVHASWHMSRHFLGHVALMPGRVMDFLRHVAPIRVGVPKDPGAASLHPIFFHPNN